jgi:hypothetical protein
MSWFLVLKHWARQFGYPGLLFACASFELCDKAQFRWLTPYLFESHGWRLHETKQTNLRVLNPSRV